MTEAEQLQNRILELQSLLGVGDDDVSKILAILDTTPQQAEIVGFLLRRSIASRDAIYAVLFGARPECDQPDIKLIDVQMVKVRSALKKVGIDLRTEWGAGCWGIRAPDKAKLRSMMNMEPSALSA